MAKEELDTEETTSEVRRPRRTSEEVEALVLGCLDREPKTMAAIVEESTDERRLERETGWGAFESRPQARAALGRSLDRDGGWWGDVRLERWAHYHELSVRQAEDPLGELHQVARVEVRDYCGARQVRARRMPRQGAAA